MWVRITARAEGDSACLQHRAVLAVGLGRGLGDLFKSQGWSDALSHQCCLAHPIRDSVALIKPKQSLN